MIGLRSFGVTLLFKVLIDAGNRHYCRIRSALNHTRNRLTPHNTVKK